MAFPSPPWDLAATCSLGFEETVAEELRALGVDNPVPRRGSVAFRGGLREICSANLSLRTAIRIFLPLAKGPAAGRRSLYELTAGISWENLIAPGATFAVAVVGRAPGLEHSGFSALVVKDAIVDRIRGHRGNRPDVDRRKPDVGVHVHLASGRATISLDATGEPLSHRGYRYSGGDAPLAETLAAGLLLLAGYDGSRPFLDPMCGSGTLAAEAALIASRTAPGLRRSFAFERWPFHDPAELDAARHQAARQRREPPQPIVASDLDGRAVARTRKNLERAGMTRYCRVFRRSVTALELPGPDTLIVTNPPYGERIGDTEQLRPLYKEIGDALKSRAAGATAWLLVGNRELAAIGLRASRRIRVFNGPIECRFLRFDLYEGSLKGEAGVGKERTEDEG
ncbi:MAG: RNA methyltransferase [Acidobacteria bacterium]|nr:RNA methyltransferase [Acidobacteriota bacterium]